jgi:hypothetical protein
MCQSKASGGRRCNGSSRTATTVTSPSPSPKASSVPSREDTDRLGQALSPDRKGWDGSPLSEKDRRFFALRDSGYEGPINQDGYPETTGRGADTLRHMAESRGETVNW